MKNYWLNRFRVGKKVRYKGFDPHLNGKIGIIVSISKEWIDVEFEFPGFYSTTRIITVEEGNLEII